MNLKIFDCNFDFAADLAVFILENLDARALAYCEAVCTSWRNVIAGGQLWRKLIEKNVRNDNLWRGLSEKKKWLVV